MITPISTSTYQINKNYRHFRSNENTGDRYVTTNNDSKNLYEEEKIRIMKTGLIASGCLLGAIAISNGINTIVKQAEYFAKKNSKNVANNTNNFKCHFEDLNKQSTVPVLDHCKSLNDQLKGILQRQVDIKNAHNSLLKKTGAEGSNRFLLNGKPGTGKSFFGKVFAKTINADFIQISYHDINSKWAGEGVEKMVAIFDYIQETASKNPDKNYVLLFNEIDSIIQPIESYANQSNGGHWLTKMETRATFLEYLEMLGEKTPNVTIIGTTNLSPKNKSLDAAAMSRFQNLIEVPLPNKDNLYEGLKMHLKRYECGKDFINLNDQNLKQLAAKMENSKYSFRDLESIVKTSRELYLTDALKNGSEDFQFKYLEKAMQEHIFTDGMIN